MEDVDNGNEVGQAVEDSLSNPVIVRKILESFSTPELRQLSFVNKLWKREAQSVMRKRGHLTAYVKSIDKDENHPREEVDAFISDLKQMNPVPFSGISIQIYVDPLFYDDEDAIEELDPLADVILAQPSLLKTASVELGGPWFDMASSAFLLTKKVVEDSSGSLEELELKINSGREDFIEKVLQDVSFPRLKILKLREGRDFWTDDVSYENYMKAILSRAPNLKVVYCNWSINSVLHVLEGTSVVPVYGSLVCAPFGEISEDVISDIKIENMELICRGEEFDFERFNRITPTLLQQSCTTTLQGMSVDAVLAVPLMCYGICLENVKYLDMYINYSHLLDVEPRILEIVKNFDFIRIFPNLNEVDIFAPNRFWPLPNHIDVVIERANAVLREPMPDRASNVKKLNLNQRSLSDSDAQFFAEMFPSIENLEIKTRLYAEETFPFASIWENWLDLKELKVGGNLLPAAGNLDSVFCGIFPEEVDELRLKDEEYLKKVNIVPVMPALTCLKKLRVLSLNHKDPRDVPFGDDATFLFSKVTALVAFARRPALTVSLKVTSHTRYALPPAMTHLEPYVSITSGLQLAF